MAGFNVELPSGLISDLNKIVDNSEKMFGEMTRAGAEIVYKILPAETRNPAR